MIDLPFVLRLNALCIQARRKQIRESRLESMIALEAEEDLLLVINVPVNAMCFEPLLVRI